MSPKTNLPSINKVIWTSFLVDVSDIVLSLIVAILSGSVVMLSQVFEGVADFVASGALVLGAMRADTPANKKFPFGYGKEIYFWSFISAVVIICVTSTFSIYFGWERYIHPKQIQDIHLAYAILIFTTFTNLYAFYLSVKRLRGKSHTKKILNAFLRSSLIETKTTFVLDFAGTLASILGFIALLVYQITGDHRFDGLGAIAVGTVLAMLGVLLIIGIRDLLIGKSASQETLKQIRDISLTIPEVKEVMDVKTMHIGSERLLINMDVSMKNNLTTREIAKLIDNLKEKIKKEIPTAKHVQIELELPS
ncbi:MAG TPA: cation diffusion facilitator family transporter [Patescibacteria group bacterium]|nr:cation diffusion facilitator family transporter [Patescibacteria group bacterium]